MLHLEKGRPSRMTQHDPAEQKVFNSLARQARRERMTTITSPASCSACKKPCKKSDFARSSHGRMRSCTRDWSSELFSSA